LKFDARINSIEKQMVADVTVPDLFWILADFQLLPMKRAANYDSSVSSQTIFD
jgi:hypothetical protein